MAYTTIKKPSDYFNTKLYTGTGSSQGITGVEFQPDFTWIKDRDNSRNHQLYDVIRGAGYVLYSDLTNAQGDDINRLSSFDSDGFSLGTSADVNDNNQNYASWNWLGANGTAANTDGSISSTVSANTTSGFSIVSYTGNGSSGATVGHGLGVTPKMIIVKRLAGGSTNWGIYHEAMGNTATLFFTTGAKDTDVSYWNNTSPTSSVFTLGSSTLGNAANTYIAYCFSEVKGYSKFGSYVGNGSTDGTFVYTGFKPAFVMIKCTDLARSWQMHNNKSDPFNSVTRRLFANLGDAEVSNTDLDFLSNGFKVKATDLNMNGSGNNYIYMAFAEAPLVGTNGVTAKAR